MLKAISSVMRTSVEHTCMHIQYVYICHGKTDVATVWLYQGVASVMIYEEFWMD